MNDETTKPRRTMLAERIFSGTWADLYKAVPDMTIEDCNSYLSSLTSGAPGSPKKFTVIIERRDKLVYESGLAEFAANLDSMHSVMPYSADGNISESAASYLFTAVNSQAMQVFDGTKAERGKLKKIFKNVKKQQAILNQENLFNQLFFGEDNEERHSDEA